MTSSIGRRLINLRLAMNWTRRELARRLSVSASAVYQIERNLVRHPSTDLILNLRHLESAYADHLERYLLANDPDDPTRDQAQV